MADNVGDVDPRRENDNPEHYRKNIPSHRKFPDGVKNSKLCIPIIVIPVHYQEIQANGIEDHDEQKIKFMKRRPVIFSGPEKLFYTNKRCGKQNKINVGNQLGRKIGKPVINPNRCQLNCSNNDNNQEKYEILLRVSHGIKAGVGKITFQKCLNIFPSIHSPFINCRLPIKEQFLLN
jgi:hypothetical protein